MSLSNATKNQKDAVSSLLQSYVSLDFQKCPDHTFFDVWYIKIHKIKNCVLVSYFFQNSIEHEAVAGIESYDLHL